MLSTGSCSRSLVVVGSGRERALAALAGMHAAMLASVNDGSPMLSWLICHLNSETQSDPVDGTSPGRGTAPGRGRPAPRPRGT